MDLFHWGAAMTDGQTCSIRARFWQHPDELDAAEQTPSMERVIVLQRSGNTLIDLLLLFNGVLADVMGGRRGGQQEGTELIGG